MTPHWRRLPLVLLAATTVLVVGPYYVLSASWRAAWRLLTMPEEAWERRRIRW